MALHLGAPRGALIDVGASDGNAERVAGYDGRLAAIHIQPAALVVVVGVLCALIIPGPWFLLRVAHKSGALG